MDKLSNDILNLLHMLGISANYTGYAQTICAVKLCMEEPERLQLVSKTVYPEVAKQCRTSCSAVERNIRTVSDIAWKNNRGLLEKLAHKPLPRKPYNTLFLSILLYALSVNEASPNHGPSIAKKCRE